MAPHSSTLAWKIPRTEEPGGLQSMGSLGVGHDWVTSLSLFTFMHWRRKWQPTPVFLPGESQGWGSLVGCCLRGHTQSWTRLKRLSSSSSSSSTCIPFHLSTPLSVTGTQPAFCYSVTMRELDQMLSSTLSIFKILWNCYSNGTTIQAWKMFG